MSTERTDLGLAPPGAREQLLEQYGCGPIRFSGHDDALFERHLLFGAEIEFLQMPAFLEIPDVEFVAVLSAQEQFGHESVLDHIRRAPFAGDLGVVAKMPGEVIRKFLRPSIDLPAAKHGEVVVVEHEKAAGALSVGLAESAHVDSVGRAVQRVQS